MLRLAVSSDGALHEPALSFLQASGLGVLRTNVRRYTAEIPTLPGVVVHFQRGADIPLEVEEGTVDMGFSSMDRFLELRREGGRTRMIVEKLGFGQCELVLEVPDSWLDVDSLADLADLSMEFRRQGTEIRVATKSPRLVESFLLRNGVKYFSITHSSGALEAAPGLGFADIIADIMTTGATMRENRLKTIHGGSIQTSQACLIGNTDVVSADPEKLRLAGDLVEIIESHLRSLEFYSITANMKGEDPEEIARYVLQHTEISGLRGPTISKVYTSDSESWYAITIIVEKDRLMDAVDHLRRIGGSSVTVARPDYVFELERDVMSRLTESG